MQASQHEHSTIVQRFCRPFSLWTATYRLIDMPGDMSDLTRSETSTVVMSTPPPEKGKSSDMSDHTLKARPWRRYITPWDRIVSHDYPGQGTEEDPYLIDWLPGDEPDPENPMTWKTSYKWVVTVTAAVATLAVAMASSTL